MTGGNTEDIVLINALLEAHPRLGDAGDIEAMIALYVPDGRYELPNGVILEGVEQMRETLKGSSSQSTGGDWGLQYMRHHLTTSHVVLESETSAHADSYFLNVNNRGLDHWGRWQDQFVALTTEGWRFQSRKVIVEGSVEGSWFSTASGLA